MKLVIVESPTKAKTIGRFLGSGYTIMASMGHVMDLPKSTLGVDVEHDFAPQFEIPVDKKKIIVELRKSAAQADEILLATDPDREGEAISANIAEVLSGVTLSVSKGSKKDSSASPQNDKFVRVTFHEITKEAIEEALKSPGKVNEDLVAAQIARRVLDRLVGYKLSPLLWQKVRRGLSAGRVQSVALRLIVEREREIGKFGKENYWTIAALLQKQNTSSVIARNEMTKQSNPEEIAASFSSSRNDEVQFELIEINNEKIEVQDTLTLYDGDYTVSKTIIDSEEKAKEIEKDLETKKYIVEDVAKKETKRSPQPPFTTSTLQQQAAMRFGYSGKRTMSLAQKLYEEGYITYHRTDSLNMAQSAISSIRKYVEEVFGEKYIPEKPRFFASRQKNAQEAHESIRPTDVRRQMSDVEKTLGNDCAKLYELIWRRAIASQMSDARIESTTVYVTTKTSSVIANEVKQSNISEVAASQAPRNDDTIYTFKTNGSILLFEGFLKLTPFGLEDKKLPNFVALESLELQKILAESHETTPPPRYNDASLIKSLEEAGIGRPSTYATIIGTIEARQYVEKDPSTSSGRQRRFIPTSVGIAVNDFLVKNFSDIDDIPFTADMEEKLDNVAAGIEKWQPMIAEFYRPFEKKLEVVKKADRVEIPTEETGEKCPKDGAPLVIRVGKFGKFISCKNFPTCDFKKQYIEKTQFSCPKDGGIVIVKKTKKGRTFYGCSNYPTCTYAAWKLTDVKRDTLQGVEDPAQREKLQDLKQQSKSAEQKSTE